jgi:hypothetical protein
MQVHDVAKAQQRAAQACGISIASEQRIATEGNVAFRLNEYFNIL